MDKQKSGRRNTYTPADAPQVRSSVTLSLNREETLSEQSPKTLPDNPDVGSRSGMTGQDLRVPVINMRNQPLMPATPRKARKLLRAGKAKVVNSNPFTIQLTCATGEATQPVTLGIDAGYRHIGFSAVTERRELISGEAAIRSDIPELGTEYREVEGCRIHEYGQVETHTAYRS